MNVLKIVILSLALLRSPLFLVIGALALVSFYSAEIDVSNDNDISIKDLGDLARFDDSHSPDPDRSWHG